MSALKDRVFEMLKDKPVWICAFSHPDSGTTLNPPTTYELATKKARSLVQYTVAGFEVRLLIDYAVYEMPKDIANE